MFYVLYLLSFALVSPLGIAVGIVITEISADGQYHQLTIGIMQGDAVYHYHYVTTALSLPLPYYHLTGLAAGTILYIVMFEVLQRERGRDVSGLLQLVAILAGFSVMLLIEVFGE